MENLTADDVLSLVQGEGIEMIDLRFCDLIGQMQHFSVPAHQFTEEAFTTGFNFDGSSVRGFQEIHESDMALIPDPNTAVVDPFRKHKTLNITCWVVDPETYKPYTRDPRYVARKAEAYIKTTGVADTAYFGPEAEFFIFDDVRYGYNEHSSMHSVDSNEGAWNSDRVEEDGNLGNKLRMKGGYFPVPPADQHQDLRAEMVIELERSGIEVEVQHHEVATAGQAEIDMRFDTLLKMADQMMLYKYIVKNVAHRNGKTVTFMPKPLFQDNGSGMHVHQSLWNGDDPLFYEEGTYANLSDIGRWYIGGLLRHAPSLMAFCAPSTNSYKRLVPGYEAPVNLVYSQRNRSAACRIPLVPGPKAKRVEFRCPDPSANPYLAFAALLMAGLDGVANRIEPPEAVDFDLFSASPEQLAGIATVPESLADALNALERDNAYLRVGGVFTDDVIKTWIDYKRKNEVDAIRLRPHPYEFDLYYDV